MIWFFRFWKRENNGWVTNYQLTRYCSRYVFLSLPPQRESEKIRDGKIPFLSFSARVKRRNPSFVLFPLLLSKAKICKIPGVAENRPSSFFLQQKSYECAVAFSFLLFPRSSIVPKKRKKDKREKEESSLGQFNKTCPLGSNICVVVVASSLLHRIITFLLIKALPTAIASKTITDGKCGLD